MPTRQLTRTERRLTALQRAALELLARITQGKLEDFPASTLASLLLRKLIDRIGPRPKDKATSPSYVITDRGRSALSYREAHTGRASR